MMTISIPGKIVLFDYGEVISIVPTDADRAQLLSLSQAEPADFWAAYWRHRHALDLWTLDAGAYWRRIQDDLGLEWETSRLHRLWLADLRSWMQIDHSVLNLLVSLQNGGTRMALLSNAGRDYSSFFRYGMLGEFFDEVFTSAELGTIKPRPEIFSAVLERLQVEAEDLLFIDDRLENIEAAARLGINGHLYTEPSELRRFLTDAASALSPVSTTMQAAPGASI